MRVALLTYFASACPFAQQMSMDLPLAYPLTKAGTTIVIHRIIFAVIEWKG